MNKPEGITIRALLLMTLISATILLTVIFMGNLFLYDVNFEYVKHVMSMDDTFMHPGLMERAVESPLLHHLAYLIIIILEGMACSFLWYGSYRLISQLFAPWSDFQAAKYWGRVGLLFTLFLFSFIFYTVGGEWFASWQSSTWNAKSATMPFIVIFGMMYLILSQPEMESSR